MKNMHRTVVAVVLFTTLCTDELGKKSPFETRQLCFVVKRMNRFAARTLTNACSLAVVVFVTLFAVREAAPMSRPYGRAPAWRPGLPPLVPQW